MKYSRLLLCSIIVVGGVNLPIVPSTPIAHADDWTTDGGGRKLPSWWGGTGTTQCELLFFAMLDSRFGQYWMHTMQEEVVALLWREWRHDWEEREKQP